MINMQNKILKNFEKAQKGAVIIETPEKKIHFFQGKDSGPEAHWKIKDWSVVLNILKKSDIGLGESYIKNHWETTDLPRFLSYCSVNLPYLTDFNSSGFLNKISFYLYNNFLKRNTKKGSQDNIHFHYDIGNDFYNLWLDPTMTYSSALRRNSNETLQEAQLNKYDRILSKIEETTKLEGCRILEIGCGWGGFATEAVKKNAVVTGITISQKQYDFAKHRLGEKSTILYKDYRDVSGVFDAIVSIEMFEAVGEKYWSSYFQKIKESLAKGGKALIQTITIQDDLFDRYCRDSDYIRHYIFPGGLLPSKKIFCQYAKKYNLRVNEVFEFGQDYAWTLRQWLKNFKSIEGKLIKSGYSPQFIRSWEFYLGLCIAGFETQRTNVVQFELIND